MSNRIYEIIKSAADAYCASEDPNIEALAADVAVDSMIEGFGSCRDLVMDILIDAKVDVAVLQKINNLAVPGCV